MLARPLKIWPLLLIVGAGLVLQTNLRGQDAAPADAPPPVPKGVEVLARGPVHEAFASLTAEPQPTKVVPKKPPKPLDEMPPEEKPEGDVLWMGGYWAWDDDRSDFLWVSGIWRTPPPNKQWVAGYWREEGDDWQWVPGFWTAVAKQDAPQEVTYMPKPPDPPAIAPPGAPPSADTFYVPGHWEWNGALYLWRGGYWARVQPNYVWVSAHYRWTPGGYIYIAGYWDYSIRRRGVLFAPVVIDPLVVDASFVYTPTYAVQDTLVVDALFVRPSTCSYYFGDYYDVSYRDAGYTSCVVYSRTNYDSIIVYERYQHRAEPNWINVQIDLSNDRFAGRAPVPPRTLIQQTTIVQNNTIVNNTTNNISTTNVTNNTTANIANNTNNVTVNRNVMKTAVLAPSSQVMAANGTHTVKLDPATRVAAQQQSVAVQQVALQRSKNEFAAPGGQPKQPRVASFNVPPTQPVALKSATISAPGVNRPAVAAPGFSRPAVTPSVSPAPTKPVSSSTVTTAPRTPSVTPNVPPLTTQRPVTPPSVKPTTPPTAPLTPKLSLPPSIIQPPPRPSMQPSAPPTRPAPPPPARRPPPPPKDKDKDKDQH
jgi:WXXGXW repeat (2 copies)